MEKPDDFLSIQEIMEILNVSRTTVYRIMEDGEIPFYQIRGRRKFKKKDIDEYVQKQKNK